MQAFKSTAYPIVFQPYSLTIHIENETDDNHLKSIFMNSYVIAKALTNQGFEKDQIEEFIDEISKQLQD